MGPSKTLQALSDPVIAEHSTRFFKTGPGEYGEGDKFLGIRVPVVRRIATKYRGLPLADVRQLLSSPWHEERLCALVILTEQYSRGEQEDQSAIYEMYLDSTRFINNWDLVDASAHKIIGPHLENRDRAVLYQLARSKSLWERRIAIFSTYHFIRNNDFSDTLRLSEQLLTDKEDLIHKASGWMLREVAKRDKKIVETFLDEHVNEMPRTMLRYTIEKFPPGQRKSWLAR